MSQDETTRSSPKAVQFQAGNALQADAFYVRRPADDELFKLLSEGHYCHVLAPRQMGKTSLVLRVATRLQDAGAKVARVDLSFLGSATTHEQWLWGIAEEIARQLGVDAELEHMWDREPKAGLTVRFGRFFTEILARLSASCTVVVFFDELDAVIERLNVDPARRAETTDFFGVMGSLHDQRARDPRLARLTLCFSGVAVPDDVAGGTSQSPFLVSRAIELNDFTREDLRALEAHLCPGGTSATSGGLSRASEMLDEIWRWTSGHPYMVQHLCHEISTAGLCAPGKSPREVVVLAVDRRFLGPRRHDDVVLAFVRTYFREAKRDLPLAKMLYVYRQLLAKGKVAFERGDDAHLRLLISGLVSARPDGTALRLEIRNRIMREVFDDHWLAERESEIFLGTSALQWLAAAGTEREHYVLRGRPLADAKAWMKSRLNVQPQYRDFIEASIEVENRETEEKLRRDLREKEREVEHERSLREKEEKQSKAEAKARRNKYVVWVFGGLLALATVVAAIASYYSSQLSEQAAQLTQSKSDLEKTTHEKLAQGQLFQSVLKLREDARNAARRTVVNAGSEGPAPTEALLAQALKLLHRSAEAGAAQAEVQGVGLESLVLLSQSSLFVDRGPKLAGDAGVVALSPESKLVLSAGTEDAALWNREDGHKIEIKDHAPFSAAAFFPDGSKVVLGSENGALTAIDVSSGKEVGRGLSRHKGRVSGIRVLPSGQILTIGDDGLVQLQSLEGQPRELLRSGRKAEAVAAARDGSLFAAGTEDGVIHLWSAGGNSNGELQGHKGSVYDLAFSPGVLPQTTGTEAPRPLLLSASADTTARVWDVAAKKLLCTAEGHTREIFSIASSPDGESFVTGGLDGHVRVWATRTCRPRWHGLASGTPVSRVAFVAEGALVASASMDGHVRIFDANGGALLHSLVAHTQGLLDMKVSADGAHLAVVSEDGGTSLWNLPSPRPLADLERPVFERAIKSRSGIPERTGALSLSYSDDGKGLFVGYDSGFVRSWTVQRGWEPAEPPSVRAERAHEDRVRKVLHVGPGRRFASFGADGQAFLWTDGASLSAKRLDQPSTEPSGCAPLEEGVSGFYAADRAVSTGLFAAAGADCRIRVWDSSSGGLRRTLAKHEHEVRSLSFSPSGASLASIDAGGTILFWGVQSSEPGEPKVLRSRKPPSDADPLRFAFVRFLSDDRLLSSVEHGPAEVWELPSGKWLGELARPGHWVVDVDVAFPKAETQRPAPMQILTSSWDQTAVVWDAATLRPELELKGHELPVLQGLFSEAGATVWTASADHRLRWWDAKSGAPLGEIFPRIGSLWDMASSPDGQYLAVAGERGRVRVFPATTRGMIEQACRLLRKRKTEDLVRDVCSSP